VRNEEVLPIAKEKRNILHTVNSWKTNWIGHIWRRNCLLKHVIGGKEKGKFISDEETRKKVQATTVRP
jgi:hypothetical protein